MDERTKNIFNRLAKQTHDIRQKTKEAYNNKDIDAMIDIIQCDIIERHLIIKRYLEDG